MEFLNELVKFILLGLLQGFTEPLPISSSGHLVLFQEILGVDNPGLSFEAIVNFGSLIAILIFYKDTVKQLIVGFFKYILSRDEMYLRDFRYSLFIVIGTIPAVIVGLLFEDHIESLKSVKTVGIALLVTALALFIIRNMKGKKSFEHVNLSDSIIIGLAQVVALLPGISRSGATVVAGMSRKLDIDNALRFSFMLYIPISVGAFVMGMKDVFTESLFTGTDLINLPVAFIVSIIATYISVGWFLDIMKRSKLIYFSIYCFVVGTTAIILDLIIL
ncbi:undecaprenyl-diphosphate phosphatase [Haloplasma contractile]|uniref:Undecaprenyl-diphosphatase n=1 Tax=Haloplasma contractile SSD-17B TaxID=1033810 RepID=U2FF52_9MOLU|nr:undecaprenyl-diphosphate phosphatase [Haloplasma contractile]ERJ11540.1 Undecaprenyl-diphosphatase 1 protein [Haloplasma contractile SSD-17B]